MTRVEDVEGSAFTEVFATSKGKLVRADFDLVHRDEHEHTLRWAQRLEGTAFGRVLRSAETEVRLTPVAAGARTTAVAATARTDSDESFGDAAHEPPAATDVTIELRQDPAGFFARFGGFMIRRAATHTIDEALDGLARISG